MKVSIEQHPAEVIEVASEVIRNMSARLAEETLANRVKDDWQHIARETVRVELIKGTYYGYASEVGVLRLAHHYNQHRSPRTRAFFSPNLQTWVFALDMSK